MKILHTSDWHLGRLLYKRQRDEEFIKFLDWLTVILRQEQVDVLLIAGDVFDTTTPSNFAQELYYRFLHTASACCRHIVVIAGNHDSPAFLDAPKTLLKVLNVHVVGAVTKHRQDEVLLLHKPDGSPELIVCAVPYLRDRDVRHSEPGESPEAKEQKMVEGIRNHYTEVVNLAEQKRQELAVSIPIIAMGHLFTAGGETMEGDGVRSLYVGSLAQVSASLFPACLDYLALGHLHVPQKVGGSEIKRYSGSPLPMGFGEAKRPKSLCLVEIIEGKTQVNVVNIPIFRSLERLKGSWDALSTQIRALVTSGSKAWLEIIYEGDAVIADLHKRLEEAVAGSALEIVCVKNTRLISRALTQHYDEDEAHDDLSVDAVFHRCLSAHAVPEEQHPELLRSYQEILTSLHEDER